MIRRWHGDYRRRPPELIEIPSGTEGLLFDCDGTLADTMPIHYGAWRETLLEYGVDCPRSFIDRHAGVPTRLIVEHVNHEFGVDLDPVRIADEKEGRFQLRLHESQPVEEVVATARAYAGVLPMGVVSGGTRNLVVPTLQAIDVLELFQVIVTADDPVRPKPAPDVFLEAARRLGVDPQRCHVFEDGEPGIVAARAAGMSVTDVRTLPSQQG
jgi:beta-phosphoglucomutase-like phosphatase (HAD superfamily)